MRVRVEKVHPGALGLRVDVEIRYRQASWLKRLNLPWKWLATDDVLEHLLAERSRQHREFEDPAVPWLPLEKWE